MITTKSHRYCITQKKFECPQRKK